MAFTNVEKQARWRTKRNAAFKALHGTPKQFAKAVLAEHGEKQARKYAAALDKLLQTIKPGDDK